MPDCINCGKYTKYKNGLCKDCFLKEKARYANSKDDEDKDRRYPSHTELYRDLHYIKKDLVDYLIDWLEENFEIEKIGGYSYSTVIEEKYWDIIIKFIVVSQEFMDNLEDNRQTRIKWVEKKINEYRKEIKEKLTKIRECEKNLLWLYLRNKKELVREYSDLMSKVDSCSQEIDFLKDAKLKDLAKKLGMVEEYYSAHNNYHFFIEYKSSINEWGKKIDQFFRQIKTRLQSQKIDNETDFAILMTFDPAFEEYEKACEMAGINLIVLPPELLVLMKQRKDGVPEDEIQADILEAEYQKEKQMKLNKENK